MKRISSFFKAKRTRFYGSSAYFSFTCILLGVSLTTLPGCGGSNQLPAEVCEIGSLVCDVSTYVCETLPVPEEVCTYVNLACLNLEILCESEPDSEAYLAAQNSLQKINAKIADWLHAQSFEKTKKDTLQ